MRIPFHQIDAFATRPFTGNPAAVMPLETWLDDATLQAIAAENNLAETAFLVPRADGVADYDLRWFTPALEVALCGHATLASGHWVLARSRSLDHVTFATRKAGVLTVARDGERLALDLPAWAAETRIEGDRLAATAAALGAQPVELWARANGYFVAVFASAANIRALTPDFCAIIALEPGSDMLLIATAPGDGDPSGADVVSRAFAPEAGIDEDPVTGSAHCVITPYWVDRLGRRSFKAYQASARGGHVDCRLDGDRVILGGTCVEVIEGHFLL